MSYYWGLLEELHQLEANFESLTPSLKEKIQTVKLEVRYILPYMESGLVTEEETKRRFRTKDCSEGLDEFVDYMMQQTMLIEPDATEFYHHGSVSKYDWRKCTDNVLNNLEYVQSLELNKAGAVKDYVKVIKEQLRFVRTFCMLVAKWNFEMVEQTKGKLHDIYEDTRSVSRSAAYLFRLFKLQNVEESVSLELSDLLLRMNNSQIQVKEAYFEILEALRLSRTENCCSKRAALCRFIEELEDVMKALSNGLLPSPDSALREIEGIVLEVEFLGSILREPLAKSGICDAISAHIIAVVLEAPLDFCFSGLEITCKRNEVRNTKTEICCEQFLDDILKYFAPLMDNNVLNIRVPETLVLELKLLRTFMRDVDKLLLVDPELKGMCYCIEDRFREAWLYFQSCCFRVFRTENNYLNLCSDILKEISVWMPKANELLLYFINCLLNNLIVLLNSDTSMVVPVKHHLDTLEKELIVLRCILMDPFKHHSEELELDALFGDIKAAAFEVGSTLYLFTESNENFYLSMEEKVQRCRVIVGQAYFKFVKLSPSKLREFELECFDVLLRQLMELKKDETDSASLTLHQFRVLHDGLALFYSFLQDNTSMHSEGLKHLRTQTTNAVWKVNNVINKYEVPEWFFRLRVSDVTEEVKVIAEQITQIYVTGKTDSDVSIAIETTQQKEDEHEFEDNAKASEPQEEILGFADEENELIRKLTKGSKQLEIFSIVGMPGLGKTTLATKVYQGVADSFHTHAWCYVSQDYQNKELIQQIASQVNEPSSEVNQLCEEDLAQRLYQSLMKKKYLIVLDDIWDIEAWNALKACCPPGNTGSRILLTSRFKTIGLQASCDSNCVEPKLLCKERSWCLLKEKVFGAGICKEELCVIGKKIAERTEGLPLSIVVIAGVLKYTEKTENKWKQVVESLDSHLVLNQAGVSKKLELSYNHLSFHMKQCFLYCAVVFRGKEIHRSKLVRLWIAEGFFDKTDKQRSMEDAAEDFLLQLVDRSLLIVGKTNSENRVQACRIHDLLHDFCIMKAEEEKFLHLVNRNSFPIWQQRVRYSPGLDKFAEFEGSIMSTPGTRSLIFVDTSLINVPYHHHSIFHKFILLNVLDLESIDMGSKFPESVTRLILLRYLAVKADTRHIPSSIGKLLNLEILVIRGMLMSVEIPDTIFNLTKLRHLQVYNRAKVSINTSSNTLHNVQSFSSPILCRSTTEQIIVKLPNLRKLKCVFMDSWDESIEYNVFPVLSSCNHLESLKVFYGGRVLYPCKFSLPASLKKLTLCMFYLPWHEIETIAELPQLEFLNLCKNAFGGPTWSASTTFPKLKYLRMEELDIEEWEASYDHFPNLEWLVIRKCTQLESIPSDFSEIETLKCIEVHQCSWFVAKSAKQIEFEQKNCSGNTQFKTITHGAQFDSDDKFYFDNENDGFREVRHSGTRISWLQLLSRTRPFWDHEFEYFYPELF